MRLFPQVRQKTLVSNGVGNVSWQNLTIPLPEGIGNVKGLVTVDQMWVPRPSSFSSSDSLNFRQYNDATWDNTNSRYQSTTYLNYGVDTIKFIKNGGLTAYLSTFKTIKRLQVFYVSRTTGDYLKYCEVGLTNSNLWVEIRNGVEYQGVIGNGLTGNYLVSDTSDFSFASGARLVLFNN